MILHPTNSMMSPAANFSFWPHLNYSAPATASYLEIQERSEHTRASNLDTCCSFPENVFPAHSHMSAFHFF